MDSDSDMSEEGRELTVFISLALTQLRCFCKPATLKIVIYIFIINDRTDKSPHHFPSVTTNVRGLVSTFMTMQISIDPIRTQKKS